MAKASESIRRKHKLLKLEKESFEQALGDTLKPIVNPLEKLDDIEIIKTFDGIKKEKNKNVKTEKKEKLYDSFDDDDDDYIINDESFKSATFADEEPLDTVSFNEQEMQLASSSPTVDEITKIYLPLLNQRNKEIDNVYGVRKLTKDRLMVGNSSINFSQNSIHVGDLVFLSTKGLLKVLFKKNPKESEVKAEDLKNYKAILLKTNAHKKHYKVDSDIRESSSFKFKQYIEKILFPSRKSGSSKRQSSTGEGILPEYMLAKEGNKLDYIYWDDPNELVNRLRLL